MLGTLRRRFILSHILPLLVTLPLMGIALIYVLETRVLLDGLTQELRGQVLLVSDIARTNPAIWSDAQAASAFADELALHLTARVMLLSPDERLLASSDPADARRVGQHIDVADWSQILQGATVVRSSYSQGMHTDVVDAYSAVPGSNGQVVGVVRLSHQLVTVFERFLRLRYLIAGVLLGGLILGAATGWVLALNMERPLSDATDAVGRLASGEPLTVLPERGPEEIHRLLHSVNTVVDRLRSAEEARRQLLANLVHELGRPLGALGSAIHALVRGAAEDEELRQELLVGMNEEIGHLQRLLDDLAGLHDQAFGTLELNRRTTEMDKWLTHTLPTWRESALAKGLRWRASIPPSLPALCVDSDRLGQALGNLLNNAIKYTPVHGTVSVDAGVKGDKFWVRVSDTGPGITQEEQERIFSPFYRSQADRRFPQGMGLGLSIARDLVAAHGGWLELDSTLGVGSRFTISLPLSLAEEG
jgi:two-component system sensor histidine kinase BaeS